MTPKRNHFDFINITNDGIRINEDAEIRTRMKFWDNIFDEYKNLWNSTFKFNFNYS